MFGTLSPLPSHRPLTLFDFVLFSFQIMMSKKYRRLSKIINHVNVYRLETCTKEEEEDGDDENRY